MKIVLLSVTCKEMHSILIQFILQTGPIIGAFNCEVLWTLAEETMLLDAVEQYGFGNWYTTHTISHTL